VLKGDRRWQTSRGLHIRDRVARLKSRYPHARGTALGFRLIEGVLPFGSPRRYAVLGARVRDRRVSAFTLCIGAAGD
jgi:hypothetical protein